MTLTPSPFLTKLAADWPTAQWREVTVLVAVSGGADSMALLRGLSQLRVASEGRLMVAHFNHKLRGADSDADQTFVEEVAREVGVEAVVGVADSDLSADRGGEGLEGAARQARYEFLARTADQVGARYVVTAHTADDHVETILINLVRGTGLAGLAGIPRIRPLTEGATLVRPLLRVTRAQVLDYLALLDKTFREDASNRQLEFTRNRVRQQLLPLLEQDFNPHVRDALRRLSVIAGEAHQHLERQAGYLMQQVLRPIPGGVEMHVRPLHDSALLGRYGLMHVWQNQGWPLQDMSFEKWEQLLAFTRSDEDGSNRVPSRQSFPGGVLAERTEGILRLTTQSRSASEGTP